MTKFSESFSYYLHEFREESNMTAQDVEKKVGIGAGWIERVESGDCSMGIELFAKLVDLYDVSPDEMAKLFSNSNTASPLQIYALRSEDDRLEFVFPYGGFMAKYLIPGSRYSDFQELINYSSEVFETNANIAGGKRDAVIKIFQWTLAHWPKANPAELWSFVVNRLFETPLLRPANGSAEDYSQSWKRTAGWALEQVFVDHYSGYLKTRGIDFCILPKESRSGAIVSMGISEHIEADKADTFFIDLLTGKAFGVGHVKASFAERRTDDVPMSETLIRHGLYSPLLTLDLKSWPGEHPQCTGELGSYYEQHSAKRDDIEIRGEFSSCFSYNTNTQPTPNGVDAKSRIYVCNFSNPEDSFSRSVIRFKEIWDNR